MELNKKNTLFPSEMVLLLNTLGVILGYMYTKNLNEMAKGAIGKDPHTFGEYAVLYQAIHGEPTLDNAKTIYTYITSQRNFLENTDPEVLGKRPGSFDFVASRLDVILPKMRNRIMELEIASVCNGLCHKCTNTDCENNGTNYDRELAWASNFVFAPGTKELELLTKLMGSKLKAGLSIMAYEDECAFNVTDYTLTDRDKAAVKYAEMIIEAIKKEAQAIKVAEIRDIRDGIVS